MFALAGCVGLAVVGCSDGSLGGVQTGPLGNDDNGPDGGNPTDARTADARVPIDGKAPVDGESAAACTGSATDVGAATTFVTGTPVYFSSGKFFVVRDAGGLYAVTAVCTHEGATCAVSGSEFHCPRHGADFTFDGAIISGPVSRPLAHYGMCILSNGHAGVTTTTVAATQRLDA